MKKKLLITVIALVCATKINAQTTAGPYTLRNSPEFQSPKGLHLYQTIPYDGLGVVQVNQDGLEEFNFQLLSEDFTYQKENTVDLKSKFTNKRTYLDWMYKMKNKTYVFVREVDRESNTEGISAIEFSPEKLDVVGAPIKLYSSSDKVLYGFHGVNISNDRTKIMYKYTLVPAEKRDKLSVEIMGLYSFDENMNKLWGNEYKMPYTEAKMDKISSLMADDGNFYQLIKVYDDETRKEATKDKKPNFHFEVLVFDKKRDRPQVIEIKLDAYFPDDTYLFEDNAHNIVIAGFYTKGLRSPIDGAFMVKLDVAKGAISRLNGGYYEIPSEVIKTYMSDRQREKIEKKEKKNKDESKELGIYDLKVRDVYAMDNGSTVIVAEQYWVESYTYYDGKTTRTTYKTYANDIFVLSINSSGKLAWVKKIPKRQISGDATGIGLSLNSYQKGNDVHIFYIDHIDNFDLPENEVPHVHANNAGGFLIGVSLDANGNLKKYNLADVRQLQTNFYIRQFVDGRKNNLIDVCRKKKKNVLFSIDIK